MRKHESIIAEVADGVSQAYLQFNKRDNMFRHGSDKVESN